MEYSASISTVGKFDIDKDGCTVYSGTGFSASIKLNIKLIAFSEKIFCGTIDPTVTAKVDVESIPESSKYMHSCGDGYTGKVTVAFNAEGGLPVPENQEVYDGEFAVEPANNPTN